MPSASGIRTRACLCECCAHYKISLRAHDARSPATPPSPSARERARTRTRAERITREGTLRIRLVIRVAKVLKFRASNHKSFSEYKRFCRISSVTQPPAHPVNTSHPLPRLQPRLSNRHTGAVYTDHLWGVVRAFDFLIKWALL